MASFDFFKIDQLTDPHIKELHGIYQQEWWTTGRQLSDVRRILAHSDVIIAFGDSNTGRLAAFARVLTDYVYKALIFDVIVTASHRGSGLGRLLMEAVIAHPALKSVDHFELYCRPDMMPFYQKWGFTAQLGQLRFMRLSRSASNTL